MRRGRRRLWVVAVVGKRVGHCSGDERERSQGKDWGVRKVEVSPARKVREGWSSIGSFAQVHAAWVLDTKTRPFFHSL